MQHRHRCPLIEPPPPTVRPPSRRRICGRWESYPAHRPTGVPGRGAGLGDVGVLRRPRRGPHPPHPAAGRAGRLHQHVSHRGHPAGLWDLVTAERVDAVDATAEVNALLATITLDDCFQPERWREFVVIAEIVPDGDVLPVRADYRDPARTGPSGSTHCTPTNRSGTPCRI